MKQIKITASIAKAMEILGNLIEGKITGFEKPTWGYKDVRFIIPSVILPDSEMTDEWDGHNGTITVPTGRIRQIRTVSFWQTNAFHLATIHLSKEDGEWNLEGVETAVDPQYGYRG